MGTTAKSGPSFVGRSTERLTPLFERVSIHRPRRRRIGYAVAVVATGILTVALVAFRDDLTPLSKGFGFLVVVVAAAAIGGLGPGILASLFGFLLFNYFFLPPYDTFLIGRGEYVVVLFVFLGLSILISVLLARASSRADAAEAREEELRTLQTLSAELVSAVPGPETYASVLSRLLEVFGFSAGALWVQDPVTRDLGERVVVGTGSDELTPGRDARTGEPPDRLPLSVGGRVIGLFLLRRERPPLTPAESRVMRSFCDQFALVLERDRLLRAATEAETYRQTEETRRSLLAAVSHDLRSPLAAIKASVTDLLSDEATRSPGQARDVLSSIDGETDRLIVLVTNLLDASRIEAGVLKARVQAVDLAEAIPASVDRVRHRWPELRVRESFPADSAIVKADPVFLDRVLSNLLDNAAQAGREGDTHDIEVESRRSDGVVTVRVIDHGAGVPDAAREQLFYPFYQVRERHPRLGTGLGLAIAKGFISLMDGAIWIEDTLGGGATFAFSLPAIVAIHAT
jgi:two-component system, OmpR family, sensor histidine kinase KdpD